MKEATLTSTANVEKSTRNVDYSSICCRLFKSAATVINRVATQQASIAVLCVGSACTVMAAIAEIPEATAIAAGASMLPLLRLLIPMTKGGEL